MISTTNATFTSLCAFISYVHDNPSKMGLSTFNYVIEQYGDLILYNDTVRTMIEHTKHNSIFKDEGLFDFRNILANAVRTHDNPTKRIFVLVGCSGAGKSTWIKETVKLYDKFSVVSRDDYIVEKYSNQVETYIDFNDLYQQCFKLSTQDKNSDVEFSAFCDQQVKLFDTVFVDMTNLSSKPRARWKHLANQYKAVLTCVVFDTTQAQCKLAQIGRDKFINDDIIDDMFKRFEYPLLGIECNDIITIMRNRSILN